MMADQGIGEHEASTSASQIMVDRVSIRVPPFWPERPGLWFASLEAQFHINGISQELTKFYYAISQLDTNSAAEVENIITSPPKELPYSTLKDALIARFSESYEEKMRRLLEKEEIGDRKASSFLRHLKALAGVSFPQQLLKTIWMSRLPQDIRGILTAQKHQSVEELGELADKLQDISVRPMLVQAANTVPDDTKEQMKIVLQQVTDLTRMVASLFSDHARAGQSSRDRSRSRSRSRNRIFCWYHNRFGTKATKCIKPCSWKVSPQENSSNNQ